MDILNATDYTFYNLGNSRLVEFYVIRPTGQFFPRLRDGLFMLLGNNHPGIPFAAELDGTVLREAGPVLQPPKVHLSEMLTTSCQGGNNSLVAAFSMPVDQGFGGCP